MNFEDLTLISPLLRAVREEGYDRPTPIQQKTILHVLEGRDILGCAQTGTGKTAAFALPILQRLLKTRAPEPGRVRVLVLSPTRELTSQIGDSFTRYGRHTAVRCTTMFGGVSQQRQVRALRKGVDVLVATPGRLIDLMQQKIARLNRVEILVLDEADRMLDMGFIHDVRRIISSLPRKRQTLFFSATLPHDITTLARDILYRPIRVEVAPPATTVETISQSLYRVEKREKFVLLARLLQDTALQRVLIFTRTKRGANKLAEYLNRNSIRANAIHGNKGQSARERALASFKRGACRVLVATDIASRGIDVDDITHVVNFDLPNVPECYVHRIGRTARAGAKGSAITFCSIAERKELAAVERVIGTRIPQRQVPHGIIRAGAPSVPANGASRPPQHRSPTQRPRRAVSYGRFSPGRGRRSRP
ncbi:MAG: DEAD/DEAH box helicase [Planctomycetota bacterium]|nr:DEAD/DEAH box helicase [Planctomycetota bacterium]